MQRYIGTFVVVLGLLGAYFGYDYGKTQCVNGFLESSNKISAAFQVEMRRIRRKNQKEIATATQQARKYKTKVDGLLRRALNTQPNFKAYYNAPVQKEAIDLVFGAGAYSTNTN